MRVFIHIILWHTRLAQQMFARMRLWVLLNRYSFSLRALRTIRLRRTLTRASDMSVVTMIIPSYIPDNSSKLFYFCVEVCEVGEENIKLVMVMDVKICFYLLSCSMARNQSCSPRWKEKMEIAGFLWMQVWVFSQDPGSRNSAIFRNMIPDSHKSLMVRQLHWTTGESDCEYLSIANNYTTCYSDPSHSLWESARKCDNLFPPRFNDGRLVSVLSWGNTRDYCGLFGYG